MVAVPVAPQPAKLPDIPDSLKNCLASKAEKAKAAATADDTVKALYAADRTKADCARKLFKWYQERQKETAKPIVAEKLPEGHPKTGKPQTATW